MKKLAFVGSFLPLVVLIVIVAFFGNTWVTIINGAIVGVSVLGILDAKFKPKTIHDIGGTLLCIGGLVLFAFSEKNDTDTLLFLYLPANYFWGTYLIFRFFKWLKVRKRIRR